MRPSAQGRSLAMCRLLMNNTSKVPLLAWISTQTQPSSLCAEPRFHSQVSCFSGQSPSQDANADASRNLETSGPTSIRIVCAMIVLMPRTSVRSTPAIRKRLSGRTPVRCLRVGRCISSFVGAFAPAPPWHATRTGVHDWHTLTPLPFTKAPHKARKEPKLPGISHLGYA